MSVAVRGRPRRRSAAIEHHVADEVIRILLVEDQLPMRAGIRLALPAEGFEIVGEVSGPGQAVEVLEREPVDIVLVGAAPDAEIAEVVGLLRNASSESRIVVLASTRTNESTAPAIAAFDAGAVGWLGRDASSERLPTLLRAVRGGERIVPRALAGALIDEVIEWRRHASDVKVFPNGVSLTSRELQVLERVAAGGTTSRVASELGISDVTVRRHVSDAVKKLGVTDRAAAARLFRTVQHEWAARPIDVGPARGQPQEGTG